MKWIKAELYITSLWLLFVLAVVLTINLPTCIGDGCQFIGWKSAFRANKIAIISFLFIAIGIVSTIRFSHIAKSGGDLPREVLLSEDINYEHLTFLTTYIIPIISFNLSSSRYLICVGILLAVIGVIYIRTDKFYSNPTLAVLGFKLYKMKVNGIDGDIVVITRSRIERGDFVSLNMIDDRVAIAARSRHD